MRPGDKRPAIPWEPYQQRRPTEYEITAWFGWGNANLGIVTGEISGLVVADLDGDDGERSYNELEWPTDSRMVKTWSGGVHVYFRHPGRRVGNRVRMRPGLDIRGDGGFAAAPPSMIEGQVYAWLTPIRPLLPLPPNPDRKAVQRPAPARSQTSTRYVETAFQEELEAVSSALEGTRNDQLNTSVLKIGRFVKDRHLSATAVAESFLSAALQAGLGRWEADATILSALKAALR